MKKIIIITLLITIVTAHIAYAAAAVALGVMGAGAASIAGYVYGEQIKATTYTAITKASSVVGKVYNDYSYRLPINYFWADKDAKVYVQTFTAMLALQYLIDARNSDPAKFATDYPSLSTAINNARNTPTVPDASTYQSATVGSNFLNPYDKKYHLVTYTRSYTVGGADCGILSGDGWLEAHYNQNTSGYCTGVTTLLFGAEQPTPPLNKTDAQVLADLPPHITGQPTIGQYGEPVYSDTAGEIDDFIKSNPNVLKFVDEETGDEKMLPLPGTPSQITQQQAEQAQQAALQKAQENAQNLRSIADQAKADALADPTNPTKAAAAAAAAAAAGAAELEVEKLKSAAATQTAAQTEKAADTAASVPNATRKTIDLSAIKTLKGALDTTYPFNLPHSISSFYSRFVAPAETPAFDLYMPLGQTLHVDLAPFEPLAIVIRYFIGIIVTVGMFYYIIHFFRGIS